MTNHFSKEYLIFNLMDELFAFSSDETIEIAQTERITPLPKMPEYFMGVMNLRGNLFPVVDLRVMFNMPFIKDTKDTVYIIVNVSSEEYEVAVRVDKVHDVEKIYLKDLNIPPDAGALVPKDFLRSSFNYMNNVVFVLEVNKLLSLLQLGVK